MCSKCWHHEPVYVAVCNHDAPGFSAQSYTLVGIVCCCSKIVENTYEHSCLKIKYTLHAILQQN